MITASKLKSKIIYGIQQIGVGVSDIETAFRWYGTNLGADVPVFDDSNVATHMAKYMGDKPHQKRAILALNMQGGSGYELWQYQDRKPEAPKQPVLLGDMGIFAVKIKSRDITTSYRRLSGNGVTCLTFPGTDPIDRENFFIQDPENSPIQIVASDDWFVKPKTDIGGVCGAIIGVSDIDKALELYHDILGYDKIIYDQTRKFADFKDLPGGDEHFRRVLVEPSVKPTGGFAELFGPGQLELVQVTTREPMKIFADRYWGDIGFIHLCFDVRGIELLIEECAHKGFPFQVDSQDTFEMGEAAGRWGYLEDPDGTLIEFVETHKLPIMEKWNLSLDLRKRNPHKPLPKWLLKALGMNRVKFE